MARHRPRALAIATIALVAVSSLVGGNIMAYAGISDSRASATVGDEAEAPVPGQLTYNQWPTKWENATGATSGWGGIPLPTFTAVGLPGDMKMSPEGVVQGRAKKLGKFAVTITATNASGAASRAFSIKVVEYGGKRLNVEFPKNTTKLNKAAKKALRRMVARMPDRAEIYYFSILGGAGYSHKRHKAKAERRAEARGYAIAKYLKGQGVKAHPEYTYLVSNLPWLSSVNIGYSSY